MKKLDFKTNINCENCIRSVTPFLNEVGSIDHWKVDINNPEKILSVEFEEDGNAEEVMDAVKKAGFDIAEKH